MCARRMFTEYRRHLYGVIVVFFIASLFLFFPPLLLPSQSVDCENIRAWCDLLFLFFFFIPEAEKQRERDKYQRENERHKLASQSENLSLSQLKKDASDGTHITRLKPIKISNGALFVFIYIPQNVVSYINLILDKIDVLKKNEKLIQVGREIFNSIPSALKIEILERIILHRIPLFVRDQSDVESVANNVRHVPSPASLRSIERANFYSNPAINWYNARYRPFLDNGREENERVVARINTHI